MHDFGKLVYLDNHKTGSTYVSNFLNHCCILPLIKEKKHGLVGRRYNSNTFYFSTIRHPGTLYSSLFRYGLDQRGGVYQRLKKAGKHNLYQANIESFNNWLRFMIDRSNASYLDRNYKKMTALYNVGFLTFRYLMFSLSYPLKTLAELKRFEEPLSAISSKLITDHVIKQEALPAGLRNLATNIKPDFFDRDKTEDFIAANEIVNPSTRSDIFSTHIENDVMEELFLKECLLFQYYR